MFIDVIFVKVVFVDVPFEAIFRFATFTSGFGGCGLSSLVTFITLALASQVCLAPLRLLGAFEENYFAAALALLLGLKQGRIVNYLVLTLHSVDSSLL